MFPSKQYGSATVQFNTAQNKTTTENKIPNTYKPTSAIKLECSDASFILTPDLHHNWSLSKDNGAIEPDFECIINSVSAQSFEVAVSAIGWNTLADVLAIMFRDTKEAKLVSILEIMYICTKMKLFEDKCTSIEVRRYACIGLINEASMLKDASMKIAEHREIDITVESITSDDCEAETKNGIDDVAEAATIGVYTLDRGYMYPPVAECEEDTAAEFDSTEQNASKFSKRLAKKSKKKKFRKEPASTELCE